MGYLDELVVLPVDVAVALRLVPDGIVEECRERADDDIDVGRARWIVAGLVVLLRALVGRVALRTFTRP